MYQEIRYVTTSNTIHDENLSRVFVVYLIVTKPEVVSLALRLQRKVQAYTSPHTRTSTHNSAHTRTCHAYMKYINFTVGLNLPFGIVNKGTHTKATYIMRYRHTLHVLPPGLMVAPTRVHSRQYWDVLCEILVVGAAISKWSSSQLVEVLVVIVGKRVCV